MFAQLKHEREEIQAYLKRERDEMRVNLSLQKDGNYAKMEQYKLKLEAKYQEALKITDNLRKIY